MAEVKSSYFSYYRLTETGEVEPCGEYSWSRIAEDQIGEARISTVFLSLDHNFTGRGEPIVFETMVFGGPLDSGQWRYRTLDAAKAGHAAVIEYVKAGKVPDDDPIGT